jgi:hypothetical protein
MSRSNPHVNAPNPATRWFEWNGEHGIVRFYDKDAKKNTDVLLPFTFLLLDELASVRGWDDKSTSGIYSNEVRDTRTDIMVVKSFKGGTLAEGLYKDIKDRVNTLGGQFVANCYIAFKDNGGLAIGSLRFKGAALGSWMEFRKTNRAALYNKAVDVVGFTEGKKGRIVFRMPTFATRDVSSETNLIAGELDKELQAWLTSYFNRRTNDQAEPERAGHDVEDMPAPSDDDAPITDSDIPF